MISSPTLHPAVECRERADVSDITALLVIEPDPETFMPTAQAAAQAQPLVAQFDDDGPDKPSQVLANGYLLAWVGFVDGAAPAGYFAGLGASCSVLLPHPLSEMDERSAVLLRDLLAGLARREPQAVVGVMGATREAEVVLAANLAAECALRTVILEPFCLSAALFLDLDEVVADLDRAQFARRVLTGETRTVLDEVLEGLDDDWLGAEDDGEEDEGDSGAETEE